MFLISNICNEETLFSVFETFQPHLGRHVSACATILRLRVLLYLGCMCATILRLHALLYLIGCVRYYIRLRALLYLGCMYYYIMLRVLLYYVACVAILVCVRKNTKHALQYMCNSNVNF